MTYVIIIASIAVGIGYFVWRAKEGERRFWRLARDNPDAAWVRLVSSAACFVDEIPGPAIRDQYAGPYYFTTTDGVRHSVCIGHGAIASTYAEIAEYLTGEDASPEARRAMRQAYDDDPRGAAAKGDDAGLFNLGEPKDDGRATLADLLSHNADRIQSSEGKSRDESEYLAACLIIDDLSKRANGRVGYQQMMDILQNDYPQIFNDVITYVGWSTGKLIFKPEYDAAMRARHGK